jgi:hypothetical protein
LKASLAAHYARQGAHFDKGFATEGGSEELPEGHLEMAAADAAQVEQGIRPGCQKENSPEPIPAISAPTLDFSKSFLLSFVCLFHCLCIYLLINLLLLLINY